MFKVLNILPLHPGGWPAKKALCKKGSTDGQWTRNMPLWQWPDYGQSLEIQPNQTRPQATVICLGLNLLSSELLQKVFTEGWTWIPERDHSNTTIFTGVIWDRLLVYFKDITGNRNIQQLEYESDVVSILHDGFHCTTENARIVHQGMRVSGSCPEWEIWKFDIYGFYSSSGHCIGIHQDNISYTAKDQRTKYIQSAIIRIKTLQFYGKLHIVRHFPKCSERSKNVQLENITCPFYNKCYLLHNIAYIFWRSFPQVKQIFINKHSY